MPNPTPLARAVVALDPQYVIRPHSNVDQDPAVLHWQSLVDAGLIGGAPAPSPAVIARREATDALFRASPPIATGLRCSFTDQWELRKTTVLALTFA